PMNSISADSIEEIEVVGEGAGVAYGRAQGGYSQVLPETSSDPVRALFEERSSIRYLHFTEAKGYWKNSYVPGDPTLRLLAARLLRTNRASLPATFKTTLKLHDAARRAP